MRIGDSRVGLTLLEVLGGGVDELQGDQLEAAFLEAANDFADETALDPVGLMIIAHQQTANSYTMGDQRGSARTLTMMYVRSLLEGMTDAFCSGWCS